jgi:ribosomal protein S19
MKKKERQRKIKGHSNQTIISYKYLKAMMKIQEGGSHLEIQLLIAAAHYDG